MTFLYSTLSGPEHVPAQDASELLGTARGLPRLGHAYHRRRERKLSRLHVTSHEVHGFVVHCEDRKTQRNAALGPNQRISLQNRVGRAKGSRGVGKES